MKQLKLFFAAAVALLAFVACGGDDNGGDEIPVPTDGTVVGQWCLTQWSAMDDADVYVEFKEDNTFNLYQRLGTPYYEHFTGTYSLSGNTLSGQYSDGVAWGSSYTVSFSGNDMTLTSTTSSADISVYTQTTIPGDVLEDELQVRSEVATRRAL